MVPRLTAQQTIDRARVLLESGRGAALPELLRIIETLSLNICEVTISDLAELIEKDAVVLAKIISVANTLAHNPGIAPIETLSQAIHQIGYNRIRTVAVSMMLIDDAGGANPPEQRDAAAFALCAGLMAQGAAECTGTHDPEFVFACATLRNFGKIAMAAISPELCREANEMMRADPSFDAYRQLFGLSSLELSRKLLGTARLPEDVMRALDDCEPEKLTSVAANYDARLLALADFGSKLAAVALDGRERSDTVVGSLSQVARRFNRLVPGVEDIARPALLRANERLRSFSRSAGLRHLASPCLRRVQHRLASLASAIVEGSDVEVGSAWSSTRRDMVLPASVESVAASSEQAPDPAPRGWEDLLTNSPSFAAQSVHQLGGDAMTSALAMACDAIQAEECLLFHSAAGTPVLTLHAGLGQAWSRFQPRAAIRFEERTVFGVCLSRHEVVLVHDTSDVTLQAYLPAWWREVAGGPKAFALIPLGTDSAHAMVLVGWRKPRQVRLTQGQVALINQIFAQSPLNAAA